MRLHGLAPRGPAPLRRFGSLTSFIKHAPDFWLHLCSTAGAVLGDVRNAARAKPGPIPTEGLQPYVGTAVDHFLGLLVGDDLSGVFERAKFVQATPEFLEIQAAWTHRGGIMLPEASHRKSPTVRAFAAQIREKYLQFSSAHRVDEELAMLLLVLGKADGAYRAGLDPFEFPREEKGDATARMWRHVRATTSARDVEAFIAASEALPQILPPAGWIRRRVYNPHFGPSTIGLSADGDLYAAGILYDLKCVKDFSVRDVYQLIGYAALAHLGGGVLVGKSKLARVSAVGFLNPRFGLRWQIEVPELCARAGARNIEYVANSLLSFA